MDYEIVFFIMILLQLRKATTTEKYLEYYKNENSGTIQKDFENPVTPVKSAAYKVKEDVDDIPDTRPLPGPVIPNHKVHKPLNVAQNKPEDDADDDEIENSGTKYKYPYKYYHKKNKIWTGKTKFENIDEKFPDFFSENFDDKSDTGVKTGFYDSVKDLVSDFKNSLWNSFSNFFSKDNSKNNY